MIRKNGRTLRRLRKLARHFYQPEYADNFGVLLPLKHPLITAGIGKEIYFGDYERKEATIVSQRLTADDVVLEIGAGIGFLSAYCAKRIGSERVFAYDANPAFGRGGGQDLCRQSGATLFPNGATRRRAGYGAVFCGRRVLGIQRQFE